MEHETVTGYFPGVVFGPTRHVQLTVPLLSAVFWSSPLAWLAPDAYSTAMVQVALGAVCASTVASVPGVTGEVIETILTESFAAAFTLSSASPPEMSNPMIATRTDERASLPI